MNLIGLAIIFIIILIQFFSEDETRRTKKDQETRYKTYSKIKNAGFEDMLKAYKDIVLTDGAKKAYRQFFDLLLANDKENEALLVKIELVWELFIC